ncbi:MAG: SDR family oxidoreductase [Chloroflexota bacterium]|nr:SDR family oxidoreductase [Chloroflexota bacterium]
MDNQRGVLVTGAAGRIGAAIVRAFAELGDRIVATDLDADKLAASARAPGERGGVVTAIPADITDEPAVERLVAAAVDALGRVDVLVNCAGIFPNTPVIEMATAEWDWVYGVNLRGPFLLSRAVARHMLAHGIRGAIVNISSGASSSARTGGAHYCGSKAALEMFTKVLAIELGPRQIRVNAVAPGLILDQVLQPPVPPGTSPYVAALLDGIPLRRTGRPEDIAAAVAFLCSDQAAWTTGTVLEVNGGSQAGRTHLPPSSSQSAR